MAMNPPQMKNSFQRRDFGNPAVQIVLAAIILVLFSWFILLPKYHDYQNNRVQLAAAKEQLTKIETDQRDLNRLVNELKSSPEEIEKIDEALPLTGRVSRVYVVLDNLVRSSAMSMSLLSVDDTTDIISAGDKAVLADPYKPGRSLHTLTVSASVVGTMEQFRNLLQLIETSSRVLDVDSVEIVAGDDGSATFRLTVKAYSYENVTE